MYVYKSLHKTKLETKIDSYLSLKENTICVNTNEFDYNLLKLCYPDKKVIMSTPKKGCVNIEYGLEGDIKVYT